MVIRLIHGDIDSGKTRRASAWVETGGLAGRAVGGILALKTPNGRRFMDIATADEIALEHPAEGEAAVPVGRFQFRQAAFDWAVRRIDSAVLTGAEAVVIDEVGPLEMRGGGFAEVMDRLARDHPQVQRVFLVRTSLIDAVIDRFGSGQAIDFDPPRNP